MGRGIKQLIYGILYLIILAALGTGVYFRFIRTSPSCFDGVQNQNEQGIDCGGVCTAACTSDLQPIGRVGEVSQFSGTPGHITLAAQVADPNTDFGAVGFSYQFLLYDASQTLIRAVPGVSFIYPGQTKYLVAVNEPVAGPVAFTDLSVATSVPWVSSSSMGDVPLFAFQNLVTAPSASGTVTASGLLVNRESVPFSRVDVVALFESSNGTIVGASKTQLDQVPAAGSVPVAVSYLADPRIDPTKTQLYGYAER